MSHPAYGLTVAVMVELLLPAFGSGVVEEPVAVLERVLPPGAFTCTTIVTVAEPGNAMSPSCARTVPLGPPATNAQVPVLGVQETNVVCGGNGSFTSTMFAGFGPRLLTVTV